MTRNYNRSGIYTFSELRETLQQQVIEDFNLEESDAHSNSYVISKFNGNVTAIPLGMFMRTEWGNNFTHGIYSDSAFSGYFITLSRCNTEAVIAYKYF